MKNKVMLFANTISHIVGQCDDSADALNNILSALAVFCHANALLCDVDGRISAYKHERPPYEFFDVTADDGVYHVKKAFADQLKNALTYAWNIRLYAFAEKPESLAPDNDGFALVAPLVAGMKRIGTMFLYKPAEFNEEDCLASAFTASIAVLYMNQAGQVETYKKEKQLGIVKTALDTLSYSELEAAIEIFEALDGSEGRIVASAIARRQGMTGSAIVNALRKLESASIVESQSLGAKGTYIKVRNTALFDELKKFKKIK